MVPIQTYNKKSRLKQEEVTEIQQSLLSFEEACDRIDYYKELANKYGVWPKTIEAIDNGKYMDRYNKKEVKSVIIDLSDMKQKLVDAAQKVIDTAEKEVKVIDDKMLKLQSEKQAIRSTPQYKEAFQLIRTIERSELGLDKN